MRLARYLGEGQIAITEEPKPTCPPGGLLVRTEASGLCSGELMAWYMDRKIPHVLGHEVCGIVEESESKDFPIGTRVFVHHHAPCLLCEECLRGAFVHCATWKKTKLQPGGMAEYFAVSPELLTDTLDVGNMDPRAAALIEPLACVVKSLWRVGYQPEEPAAVVGLGVMGLMHMLMMPGAVGYDTNPSRLAWARQLGLNVLHPDQAQEKVGCVIVCPGSENALNFGLSLIQPDARLCLFAPMPPASPVTLDLERLYFADLKLIASYSCGPDDTRQAFRALKEKIVLPEQVVSSFIELSELPEAYLKMRDGLIVKAMVLF